MIKPDRLKSAARLLHSLFIAVLLLAGARTALAAVTLIFFAAETEADRIRLDWETGTELDNSGFVILRSENGNSTVDQYTPVPVIDATTGAPFTFIPARGDDLVGAVYAFFDENVVIGTRYYYYLEDIDTNNLSNYHGPEEAVAGQTNTPTPTITSTAAPTGTAAPPNATPSRTPTQAPASPTAVSATSTPIPTGTSTPTGTAIQETVTASPDTRIGSVDLTLTAIYASVTQLPTGSPTSTPAEVAARTEPTQEKPTASVETAQAAQPGDSSNPGIPTGRLLLVLAVFLISGGLLTVGIIWIVRRNRADKDSQP